VPGWQLHRPCRAASAPTAAAARCCRQPAAPAAPAGAEDFDACFDLDGLPGAEALLGGGAALALDPPALEAAHELQQQPAGEEGPALARAAELAAGPFDYRRGFALAMSTSHLQGSPRVSEEDWTLVEEGGEDEAAAA
jgi:hypothetical protein